MGFLVEIVVPINSFLFLPIVSLYGDEIQDILNARNYFEDIRYASNGSVIDDRFSNDFMEKVLETGRGGMKDALEQLMNMIERGTGIVTGNGEGSIYHPSRDQSRYW